MSSLFPLLAHSPIRKSMHRRTDARRIAGFGFGLIRLCLVSSVDATSMAFSATTTSSSSASAHGGSAPLLPHTALPYQPPSWAKDVLLETPVQGRLRLANLPTPLYRLGFPATTSETKLPNEFQNMHLFIKRDDSTGGVELGGNKIRKLEFLMADALSKGCDSVITIGGTQSNHCRATAAAARMLGMEPHLILRTKKKQTTKKSKEEGDDETKDDVGLVGNLLLDRMVGSQLYTCTPGEYGRVGSTALVARLQKHLRSAHGKNPYPIPVGGSNGLGSWGYINAVDELLQQWMSLQEHMKESSSYSSSTLDHVVFACGSGGTATGIALGLCLAFQQSTTSPPPVVHAIGVCDDPDYFYSFVAEIAKEMGLSVPPSSSTDPASTSMETYI